MVKVLAESVAKLRIDAVHREVRVEVVLRRKYKQWRRAGGNAAMSVRSASRRGRRAKGTEEEERKRWPARIVAAFRALPERCWHARRPDARTIFLRNS